LKGQHLPEGKGVTYRLFGQAPPADDQGDGSAAQTGDQLIDQNGCIYVPDVVMNPDMYFFNIPRLGAYMAVPIQIRTYLNDQGHDDAVAKIKLYKDQVAENENLKLQRETELQEKIEAARGTDEEEAQRLTKELNELEWEPVPFPEFEANVLNYVLCCDTLGKDKELSQADRDFIFSFCEHFKRSWEEAELEKIKAQADHYIEYQKTMDPEETIFQLIDQEDKEYRSRMAEPTAPQTGSEIEGIEALYREEEARKEVVTEQLTSGAVMKVLLDLRKYDYIKFSKVIQIALLLLGYKKSDINIPGTNNLDWKKVREFFDEKLIYKILAYQPKGSKPEPVEKYALLPVLQERLAKIGTFILI